MYKIRRVAVHLPGGGQELRFSPTGSGCVLKVKILTLENFLYFILFWPGLDDFTRQEETSQTGKS